ncbi:MAG: hypothetical protein JXQ99_16270 [Hyphomicrobiaceae bacterium]
MLARHIHTTGTTLFALFAWALALALIVLSAGLNFTAGRAIWGSEVAHWGLSIAVGLVLVDLAKFALSVTSADAWRDGRLLRAGIIALLVLLFAALSVAASFQLGRQFQAEALGVVKAKQSTIAELKAQRSRFETELATYGAVPSPIVVERHLNSMRFDRRWQSSEGCTKATAKRSRDFCAEHGKRFAQLAAAVKADKLRTRIDKYAEQITQRTTGETETVRLAGLATAATWLDVETDDLATVLMILIACAFEVSAIAIWTLAPRPSLVPNTSADPSASAGAQYTEADTFERVTNSTPSTTPNASPKQVSRGRQNTSVNTSPNTSAADTFADVFDGGNITRLKPHTTGVSVDQTRHPSVCRVSSAQVVQITSANTSPKHVSLSVQITDQVEVFADMFLAQRSNAKAAAADVFETYAAWSSKRDMKPLSKTAFGRRMTALGFIRGRAGKGGLHCYKGVELKETHHG